MSKHDRIQRIAQLRDAALAVLAPQRSDGNVEIDGQIWRIKEFQHNEFRMELRTPFRPKDGASMLIIRYGGSKVLIVEWDDRRILRSSYRSGVWENLILAKGQNRDAFARG